MQFVRKIGAVIPLRRSAPALPEGEPRPSQAFRSVQRWKVSSTFLPLRCFGLCNDGSFHPCSCLSLRERYLPKGGGEGCGGSGGWRKVYGEGFSVGENRLLRSLTMRSISSHTEENSLSTSLFEYRRTFNPQDSNTLDRLIS